MLWIFVQKVERIEQLYFGRFDEGYHGLAGNTFHFKINIKKFRF
jgi:hypothetical protein